MTGFLSAGAAQAEETDGAVDSVVQDTAYPGDGDTSEDAEAAQDSGDTDLEDEQGALSEDEQGAIPEDEQGTIPEDEQGALSEDEADDTAALPESEDASGEDTGEALSEEETLALLLADLRDTMTRMLSAAVITLDLVQTLGNDVTPNIMFSGGTLTTSSGDAVINGGTVTANWGYKFTVNWAASGVINDGDSFSFSVPAIFGQTPITIKGSDTTDWGTITFAADPSDPSVCIATAIFNSNAVGKSPLSGSITLTAAYTATIDKDGTYVTWTFALGSIYSDTYTLTAIVKPSTMTDETADLSKNGGIDSSIGDYRWTVFLNERNKDWGTGTITVTDTIGIGHKLTAYYNGGVPVNMASGYYGLGSSSKTYFRIWVVNWDAMRADYNVLYGKNGTSPTPPVSPSGLTTYGYYEDENGVSPADIPPGVVTNYMLNSAFYDTDTTTTGYKYLTPYTGNVTTSETADGFVLVFPDGIGTDSLYITYYTKLTAATDPGTLENTVAVSGTVYNGSKDATCALGGSSYATGSPGQIVLFKSDAKEKEHFADVKFTLEYQGIASVGTSSLTGTTSDTGYLCFMLNDFDFPSGADYAGTYLLTEVAAPDGYINIDPVLLTLDANGYITAVNGTSVLGGGTVGGVRVDSTGLYLEVHNEKKPPSVDVTLDGTKTLNGRSQAAEEFSFLLKDSDNDLLQTVQNTENGTFQFEALTFYEEGTYTYTVRESDGTLGGVGYDTTVYTVTIEVTENSGALEADVSYSVDGDTKGAINFTNTYSAVGSLTLTGEKSLSGRTQTAGEFTFTVVEDNGTTAATGANQADGAILFSAFEYKYDTTNDVDDRGTHIYTVKEAAGTASGVTYDTAVYTVEVTVEDDGNGGLSAVITAITKDGETYSAADPLSFTNSYSSGSKGGGGGGTTTTPTPTPTTPTTATPEPSTEPTPTATVTPGDGTGTTATPSTNDTQLPAAPEPANPGSTLVLNETGTGYIEIGADGTPLGTWTVGDDGVWIFSEAVPLGDYVAVTSGSAGVSGIPQTGDPVPLTLLVVILCLSGGALLLLLFTGRKKKE